MPWYPNLDDAVFHHLNDEREAKGINKKRK
jgi:hypothetical protein